MIELLEKAIASLKHAQTFISSREKMPECGRVAHQGIINKLTTELDRRKEIKDIKNGAMELIEQKFMESVNEDEIKYSDSNTNTLEEAIARFKDEQK
jgi:hypothetical protein